jgi:transcriptional regulator with XRE-family HTH domain
MIDFEKEVNILLTEFGRFLRKLRIDCGELICDMASKLDVTASYLSAVETGKRNIPETWVAKIATSYELDKVAHKDLAKAAVNSARVIKINLEQKSTDQRETAILFAREFEDIDDKTMLKIRELLVHNAKVKGE